MGLTYLGIVFLGLFENVSFPIRVTTTEKDNFAFLTVLQLLASQTNWDNC